jgi:hypothetical protein
MGFGPGPEMRFSLLRLPAEMSHHEGAWPYVRPNPSWDVAGNGKAGLHSVPWSGFVRRFCWKPETRKTQPPWASQRTVRERTSEENA